MEKLDMPKVLWGVVADDNVVETARVTKAEAERRCGFEVRRSRPVGPYLLADKNPALGIQATEYRRQDGISIHLQSSGKWWVRKINGPFWVYSKEKGEFQFGPALTKAQIEELSLPFDEALNVLQTLPENP